MGCYVHCINFSQLYEKGYLGWYRVYDELFEETRRDLNSLRNPGAVLGQMAGETAEASAPAEASASGGTWSTWKTPGGTMSDSEGSSATSSGIGGDAWRFLEEDLSFPEFGSEQSV